MNDRFNPFSKALARPALGMTLVELMAGLVILGVLTGSVLVARSRHLHQLALARRQMEAVTAANQLLESWWNDPAKLPHNGEGTVEGFENLRWRVHERDSLSDELDKTVMVTLDVYDVRIPVNVGPLSHVEILLPQNVDANGSRSSRSN